MTNLAVVVTLLKEAGRGWIEHRTQRLAAAMAFYTMLALAPLAIIAISVAGYFLGEDAARAGIVAQIEHLVSKNAAVGIEGLIDKASEPEQSRTAAAISIGLLLFSATAVFVELKDSLDTVWEVKRKRGIGLWRMVKTQFFSFAVVVSTGLLLLASLLLTTFLTACADRLSPQLKMTVWTAYSLDLLVSFLIVTFLFALIFKLLPAVTLRWKHVWIGAFFTAALFMVGKFMIGVYLGGANMGSVYQAAGSLLVILFWTYYSSQVLFVGAELIRAYAKCFDLKTVDPAAGAIPSDCVSDVASRLIPVPQ